MHILPKSQFLHEFPFERYFSSDLTSYIEIFSYKAGEWIIEEGMNSHYLFYILKGKAKIYVTHQNGKVSLLNLVEPGDFLGEMELLHETYHSKAVQATTDLIALAIPFQRCREQLLADAKFLKELAMFISKKASAVSSKYIHTLAFPLENRLAEFILQTAHNGIYKEKHVIVADYLGVSYRHLLFTLAQFTKQGYLTKQGRTYSIANLEELQALANTMK